jgi:hypothetical protein
MWKRYLLCVAVLTVLIVCALVLLNPNPRAHGSWQILTENVLEMPGLFVIGPLFGSPEDEAVATFCRWAIIVISAAVYALPVFGVWMLLRRLRLRSR